MSQLFHNINKDNNAHEQNCSMKRASIVSFMNVCHLKNKVDDLQDLMTRNAIDVMCLAGTFLDPSVPDHILNITGYQLYWRDRPGHGGGVAMYVKGK